MNKVRKIAATVVLNDDNILLIKRKYGFSIGDWCAPGGFTEKEINESVEDCAVRETKEETNIDVELIKKIKVLEHYNEEKERTEEVHIFLAKPLSSILKASDEVLDAKWFDLKEIDKVSLVPGMKEVLSSDAIHSNLI